MDYQVETITYKDFEINILQDPYPENPLICFGTLGMFITGHQRYDLGTHTMSSAGQFWDKLKELKSDKKNPIVINRPVYLYDHSGLTVSFAPFSCPWDSMHVGRWVVRRQDILDWFGGKRLSKVLVDKARDCLDSELALYDSYLRGDVYGYTIEFPDGEEDSCFGFYGSDFDKSGLMENARDAIDCYLSSAAIPV